MGHEAMTMGRPALKMTMSEASASKPIRYGVEELRM
jgi:hypothetical protein